jgi:hypothetical protein
MAIFYCHFKKKNVSLKHPESSVAKQIMSSHDLRETVPDLVTLDIGEIMDPEFRWVIDLYINS